MSHPQTARMRIASHSFFFGRFLFPKVECSQYCSQVLVSRMTEGAMPTGKIFNDVATYEPTGAVLDEAQAIAGGFPCQASILFLFSMHVFYLS